MIRACWCRVEHILGVTPHQYSPSQLGCPERRVAWKVRRRLFPHAGPVGTPAWRWCVSDPRGLHKGSAREHWRAVRLAHFMAHPDD